MSWIKNQSNGGMSKARKSPELPLLNESRHMTPHQHSDLTIEAMKAAPPVFVSASSFFLGFSWSDAAYALTAIYTLLMITQHIWEKWIKPHRKGKRGR